MKPLTPAQMLQIGFDCGLTTVSEAYSQIMSHYDCFFLIEKINEQLQEFNERLEELGFLDCYMGKCKIKNLTILAAAESIGYVIDETPIPISKPEGEVEPELFSLADVEPGFDLEHILGKREYEEER